MLYTNGSPVMRIISLTSKTRPILPLSIPTQPFFVVFHQLVSGSEPLPILAFLI